MRYRPRPNNLRADSGPRAILRLKKIFRNFEVDVEVDVEVEVEVEVEGFSQLQNFSTPKIFEIIFLRRRIARGFRICPRISRARSVAQVTLLFCTFLFRIV